MYMGVLECFREVLIDALAYGFGVSRNIILDYFNSSKLRIVKTPNPSFGDYGIALHPLFHAFNIDRGKWGEVFEKINNYMSSHGFLQKCFVKKICFVNGYLNIFIDYNKLFKKLLGSIIDYSFFKELESIGNGLKIIVEHTSANPAHPLHIGSGRNAVLGNSYARLLEKLGYSVYQHFYVNDMGRQVATLVYGYSILKKHGIKPDNNIKIDHWFGAVYALTNTLIEKKRLISKTYELEKKIIEYMENVKTSVKNLLEKYRLNILLDLLISFKRITGELKLRHDTLVLINSLIKKLEDLLENMGDENSEIHGFLEKILSDIRGFRKEYVETINMLKEYVDAETRLASQYTVLYEVLSSEITDHVKAENEINEFMKKYEYGDKEVIELFREVVSSVLEGFRETLEKLGIVFESFDWESLEPGRKYLDMVLEKISMSPYCVREDNALIVDLEKAGREHKYIMELFYPDTPGRIVLRRSDGTTLYVSRDIAYSIYKVRDYSAVKVYNVIATEQDREQKQVKAILYLLGYRDVVDKLVHFMYEMVVLKNMKMSSRRGQYYSLDELIKDYIDVVAHKYITNQLRLGREKYFDDTKQLLDVFEKLGIACTRALLLSVEPRKVLSFDPRKIEEYDMGAWIIYTFVRIQSILRKTYGFEPLDHVEKLINKLREINNDLLDKEIVFEPIEKNIVEKINDYQSILVKAYRETDPSKILEYTRELCMYLNQLYEKYPVIGEKNIIKKKTRLAIIILSLLILKELLEILGFPLIKKL